MSRILVSSLPPALKKLIPESTASQISKQPRSLYETLSRLPKDGVGSRVYQTRWQSKRIGGCYYEVTKVQLKDEGKHGKAWGKLVWKGKTVSEEEERIRGALKYQWGLGVSRGVGVATVSSPSVNAERTISPTSKAASPKPSLKGQQNTSRADGSRRHAQRT